LDTPAYISALRLLQSNRNVRAVVDSESR